MTVTVIETHFAFVFLVGEVAYKLKKTARHPGMDYSTLAARERGCRDEVRLNRRLARGVYRGVVPVTAIGNRLVIGRRHGGRIVDWLVVMRRLDPRAMLDRRFATMTPAKLEPIVKLLAHFHAHARPEPYRRSRYLARLAQQVAANRAAIARYRRHIDAGLLRRVFANQRALLTMAARMLGDRAAHVVEGHGDLRAEHVCLRPVAAIDCLEFDARLRRFDPYEDLALLALELERGGRPDLARWLFSRFGERLKDPVSPALTHIYMCLRATVRAKLALWHIGDPQFPRPGVWIRRAGAYLRCADRHAARALGLLSRRSTR